MFPSVQSERNLHHVSLLGFTSRSHKFNVEVEGQVATWVGSEPHRALVTLSAVREGGGEWA